MRITAWIWFIGCAVWMMDGLIGLRFHAPSQARLDFIVALVFFAAALFFRQQHR